MSIEIKIRKNEPIDRALRRMKKKLDRENIIKGTRAKRYYEKPCEKRRRKNKVQAFTLFATHYFELTALPESHSGIRNVHLDAVEHGDQRQRG